MPTALALIMLAAGGCASSSGPAYLTIGADQYHRVFDAAVEAARDRGMQAILRDRRSGVIETSPVDAGSALEPWKGDSATFGQGLENTLAHQRRRARFEFAPAGFHSSRPTRDITLTGPDLLATGHEEADLTGFVGDLELRVWVYVERAHTPGVRRGTWSRALTTRTVIIDPDSGGRALPGRYWTPVARDTALERRLLAAIDKQLAAGMPND
ncbi:MAG: hypothetical protein JSV91_03090 [Phycisphaerales bacterium]|nr:MAG: hypothetical protein JSV91_03090 [Phycisphaerales bacterium]